MQGGFSFCGVDIAKFGLEYVPTLDQTYVFGGSNYEVHQETFDAHHGGYFYGTTVQPKDFTLRCVYQNSHIAHGSLSAIESFFRRGKTGRLVFDKRNWLWYTATVVGVDLADLRNYENGFVTIQLRAYYPFARHDHISLCKENMFSDYIASNSGLLNDECTPDVSFKEIAESKDILLYNGGSERASVAIVLSGDAGEGVTITNHTTNQKARFVSFTQEDTTFAGKHIICDSLNGKTVLSDGTTSERCFQYHDYGFIDLEPSFPIVRDAYVMYTAGSNRVVIIGVDSSEDAVGRHLLIDDSWIKIIGVDGDSFVVSKEMQSSGACYSDIVAMNEINIELEAGAHLSELRFVYKPTFQ